MTLSTGQRRHHFKNTLPSDPAITPFAAWPLPNRSFQRSFYHWLKAGGYSPSSLNTYSVAARLALGYLNKLHWTIDPETDMELVRHYLTQRYSSAGTRHCYHKGLDKLAEYLRLRQNKAARLPSIHWKYYLDGLPEWLRNDVREFVAHKQKGWRPDQRYRLALGLLSPLCQTLRWMEKTAPLSGVGDITPQLWFEYLDALMTRGQHPVTINNRLFCLKAFLHFLDEGSAPVCQRTLLVQSLKTGPRLPKDAPIAQLRRLLAEIEQEASAPRNRRRMGIMDRAWVDLMLYSGLRTCEVRRLRFGEIDWESRRIRIEQSKGLKDRLVYVNSATLDALRTWLEVRGQAEYLSDHVFVYRCQPLGRRYCAVRMRTYGRRCGATLTPHQLRHSCATLLLNAGAPVLAVQMILGHEKVDTTLGYARLYDGTVAADYYRALGQIEQLFFLPEKSPVSAPKPAELVALLDSLGSGTLNEHQRQTVQALREGIFSLMLAGDKQTAMSVPR